MANNESSRLPIKVILPNQGHQRKVSGGGGPPRPFREVTRQYRRSLRTQVRAVEASITRERAKKGPVPVRVTTIPKAVAKSHRPKKLFSDKTCPIIGAGRLGELFLKGTREGLQALGEMIERDEAPSAMKEISSIQSIEAVTPDYRRRQISSADILRQCPRVGKRGFLSRVRLFDFGRQDQESLLGEFHEICSARKLVVSQKGYSPKSFVYAVKCRSVGDVDALSKIVGVRAMGRMPRLQVIRPRLLNHSPLPKGLAANPGGDVPVVVVVDSGISTKVPGLESWVVGRESSVAPQYRNDEHGSFVAGLICWGAELNPGLAGIDRQPCAVFDLQVIPNGDPAKGDVDELTEQEFLQTLETTLKEHANKYKVWNLSLGSDEVCSLDEFSALAEQLDDLQEQYLVSFVISAGNYEGVPLLDYPRTDKQLSLGRITSPADSVLGITVGSISHVGYKKNGPARDCPSAFSRHGAGPNHIIKPDLVHYGGTCSTDRKEIAGMRSVNGKTSAENLGTSFSTPLVSRSLAQIYHQITPTPSPVLARALLTHHARDPRTGGRVPDGEENFLGFGRPAPPPYCIACEPYTSTLVFEDVLRPGFYLEWDDFPYPGCLQRNGRYYGEIWMTVAFAPARGARWGTEYCETHVDAHFGVYYDQVSHKTKKVTRKFKGLVPPEHKNPGILYESFQVRELRKWAPVRTYHGDLGNGERGIRWRLKLQLLTRHGIEDAETYRPQPFALMLTIADPEKKAPVYDEMARIIRTRFRAENLNIRTAARVRPRVGQ